MGFQRATEGTVSLLLAIDYLGEGLGAAEVAEIEQNVLAKGVPACIAPVYGMKFPDRVQGWGWNPRSEVDEFRHLSLKRWPLIINATNLKIIPTASLGIAACHFRGRVPEAEGWLELARSSAKAFSTMYGSDGAYDEGVSYWGYTTLYLALFAEVLWRTQGGLVLMEVVKRLYASTARSKSRVLLAKAPERSAQPRPEPDRRWVEPGRPFVAAPMQARCFGLSSGTVGNPPKHREN